MDVKRALGAVFRHPWIRKIPAPSLVASALAALVHPALAVAGFQLPAVAEKLAKVGFAIGKELLPSLVEAGRRGIEAVAEWFERRLGADPEVNEAAARTMVEQAEATAETLAEARGEDRSEVAAALGEGMKAYGGATATIADSFAAAVRDPQALPTLKAQMIEALAAWGSQSIEARRDSLVEDVEQRIAGRGGEQRIVAEDQGTVRGVKQIIE